MARKRPSKAVPFRVHFERSDTGEKKVADITATSADAARATVEARHEVRLIFHKTKVVREETADA